MVMQTRSQKRKEAEAAAALSKEEELIENPELGLDWPEIHLSPELLPQVRKIIFNTQMLKGARLMVEQIKTYKKYQIFRNLETVKSVRRAPTEIDLDILEKRLRNDFYAEPMPFYEDLLQVLDPAVLVAIDDEDAKAYGLAQYTTVKEIIEKVNKLLSRRSRVTKKLIFES